MYYSKLSKAYEMNREFNGHVYNEPMRSITKFPLGHRSEPHNAGARTLELFENPISDKKGYTKVLEMKKDKLNSAVIIYTPIDPKGENSPSALFKEWELQGLA